MADSAVTAEVEGPDFAFITGRGSSMVVWWRGRDRGNELRLKAMQPPEASAHVATPIFIPFGNQSRLILNSSTQR